MTVGTPFEYRTGRKNGHTIYWQEGAKPSDKDRFVGSCVSITDATALVELANAGLESFRSVPEGPS